MRIWTQEKHTKMEYLVAACIFIAALGGMCIIPTLAWMAVFFILYGVALAWFDGWIKVEEQAFVVMEGHVVDHIMGPCRVYIGKAMKGHDVVCYKKKRFSAAMTLASAIIMNGEGRCIEINIPISAVIDDMITGMNRYYRTFGGEGGETEYLTDFLANFYKDEQEIFLDAHLGMIEKIPGDWVSHILRPRLETYAYKHLRQAGLVLTPSAIPVPESYKAKVRIERGN